MHSSLFVKKRLIMRTRKGNIRRSYIISTISISLVLFLLGMVGYAITSLYLASDEVKRSVVAIIEIKDGINESQRDSIQNIILEHPIVSNITYTSKDVLFQDEGFRSSFDIDLEELKEANPLLDTFDVNFVNEIPNQEAIDEFVSTISDMEEIERVSYPKDILNQLRSSFNAIQMVLFFFGIALVIISLFLLNSTIRFSVMIHYNMVNALKMVGATTGFIRKPFIKRSLLESIIAGIIACSLLSATLYGLGNKVPSLSFIFQEKVLLYTNAVMFIVGIVITMIFTIIATNKLINTSVHKKNNLI